jgi:hypothetical protein
VWGPAGQGTPDVTVVGADDDGGGRVREARRSEGLGLRI